MTVLRWQRLDGRAAVPFDRGWICRPWGMLLPSRRSSLPWGPAAGGPGLRVVWGRPRAPPPPWLDARRMTVGGCVGTGSCAFGRGDRIWPALALMRLPALVTHTRVWRSRSGSQLRRCGAATAGVRVPAVIGTGAAGWPAPANIWVKTLPVFLRAGDGGAAVSSTFLKASSRFMFVGAGQG